MMLDPSLFLEADLEGVCMQAVEARLSRVPASRLHEPRVQAGLVQALAELSPRLVELGERALSLLARPPHLCVLRGTRFTQLSEGSRRVYIAALSSLLGHVSDDNRFSSRSGVVADEVRPLEPSGSDVTYTLGACEIHSDESSKPRPEDIVALWCVRPAEAGGASLVWSMRDVQARLAASSNGPGLLDLLRSHCFPFGGKLRQPPRVLLAPILFGEDGVRFRLGAIRDAFEVLRREPAPLERAALESFLAALAQAPAYEYRLESGEALLVMNRRTLHSRTDFSDTARLLLRTRCFNDRLSNSHQDTRVTWLQAL